MLQTPFSDLDTAKLNTDVMKYVKDVMKLEKGLPPNGVVPLLKEKVEGMRNKVNKNYIYQYFFSIKEMRAGLSESLKAYFSFYLSSYSLFLQI